MHLVVDEISSKAKQIAVSDYELSLEAFSSPVEMLLSEYSKEHDRYRLDEIVVAAIIPTVSDFLTAIRLLLILFVSNSSDE